MAGKKRKLEEWDVSEVKVNYYVYSGYSIYTQWNVSEAGDQGIPLSM